MPDIVAPFCGLTFEGLPEDLRTLAELGLSEARRELERSGRLNLKIVFRGSDGEVVPYRLDDEQCRMFFSDEGKDYFYHGLRAIVEKLAVTAVVMVYDVWSGIPTEKLKQLPKDQRGRLVSSAKSISEMVEEGWMTRAEAVLVNVQTAEYLAMVHQEYLRDNALRRIIWLDRHADCFPQEGFSGHMKLYGKVDDEPGS